MSNCKATSKALRSSISIPNTAQAKDAPVVSTQQLKSNQKVLQHQQLLNHIKAAAKK